MADSNTPEWLSEGVANIPIADSPMQVVAIEPLSTSAPAAGGNGLEASTDQSNTTTAADQEDLPRIILLMRLSNMGAATALIICSVRFLYCLRQCIVVDRAIWLDLGSFWYNLS